jgi:SAM-dependent MidA family methyltransferase
VEGFVPWRTATEQALYGSAGFFRRPDGPGAHFRTSVHASSLFATAVLTLLDRVDTALGHPDPLDLVDVGAGRGELLTAVAATAPAPLRTRLRLSAVERAARPDHLSPDVTWTDTVPPYTGLLFANEWLDNVPVDVAELDASGIARLVLVEPDTGEEDLGPPLTDADTDWLRRWWPLRRPGHRAELGAPRDAAWADAVARLVRGLAVAVDYGHIADARPSGGTLTGYASGRQVFPVPDGSCDLTAHVAMDAVAAAGEAAGADATIHSDQRSVLRGLGLDGRRPPRELASKDPAGYLRALAAASEAGELLDPGGLGAFRWLAQSRGLPAGWLHEAVAAT